MSNANDIAELVLRAARERNFLDGPLAQISALAEVEKQLFLKMFEAVKTHREQEGGDTLRVDEIASMFNFVTARAVEAVLNRVNNQAQEYNPAGLFDGDVEFTADEETGDWLRELNWASDAATAFLEGDAGDAHPLLALFEALKWTWRIAVHLTIEHLEDRGIDPA